MPSSPLLDTHHQLEACPHHRRRLEFAPALLVIQRLSIGRSDKVSGSLTCPTGAWSVSRGGDSQRFLHAMLSNNTSDLRPGQGCYATPS